ncbi:MAG TPA: DUF5658 family protein [Acidobacteriota bacterium]|nr:DUF5658 family protein [Acidobacteriota bacterium]
MKQPYYCDPDAGKIYAERRSGIKRRAATSLLDIFSGKPRRRKSRGRRSTDQGAYVDRYGFHAWGLAISVIVLSFLDAALTRMHLMAGHAEELNPFMRILIEEAGMPVFFAAKGAMTIFPIAIIIIHKEWTFGRYAARLCLWAYILLSIYHIILLLYLN